MLDAVPVLLSIIAGLLSVLVALVAFFGREGLMVLRDHGGRLSYLERCYIRRHPEEYRDFKIGGSE